MRSLGLDVGDKRIGVAISDPLGLLARPLLVLERCEDAADIAAILKLVQEHEVKMIIVGSPISLNGSFGSQAEKVQNFAEQIKVLTSVPLEYRDERYSTADAKSLLEAKGKKKKKYVPKGAYDAAAAAVILQSYLNETRPIEYPAVEQG